jgi:hypothetical protein
MARLPRILQKFAEWDLIFQIVAVLAIALIGVVAYCAGGSS